MLKILLLMVLSMGFLSGCGGHPPATINYSSPNAVSFKYTTPVPHRSPSMEIRDMASQHCEKHGKSASYVGVRLEDLGLDKVYEFTCEDVKVIIKK